MAKKKKRTRSYDPVKLLINAQSYHASSMVLDAQPTKALLFWPMVAVEAFALELFLKCLHRVRRRHLEGHSPRALFRALSAKDRKKIAEYFAAIVSRHPDYEWAVKNGYDFEVDSVLLRAEGAFTDVRYWHEGKIPSKDTQGHSGNAGTGSLSEAVRQLIFEIHPEWQNLGLYLPETMQLHRRPSTPKEMPTSKKSQSAFEPFWAFVNARGFHIASSAIEEESINKSLLKYILFWPNLATEALGLELHLKCLHAVRGNFQSGHDIEVLYDSLSKEDKAEVEDRLPKIIAKNPYYKDVDERGAHVDINSILQRAKDMYNKARYWHEGNLPSQDSYGRIGNAGIGPLSDAIFEVLIRINPGWMEDLRNFWIANLDDEQPPT